MERMDIHHRGTSFLNALSGLRWAYKTQPNFVIHSTAALLVVYFGWRLKIERGEWPVLILTIAFVLVAELLNTAIEFATDGLKAHKKTEADDRLIMLAKDIAAGAVLTSAIFAVVVGLIIFLPHLLI